jgi:hypothetical protein
MTLAGVVIAAVGAALLVLPGPGIVVLAAGLALSLRGAAKLRKR